MQPFCIIKQNGHEVVEHEYHGIVIFTPHLNCGASLVVCVCVCV